MTSQRGDCLHPDNFCSRPDGGNTGMCLPPPRVGEACGPEPFLSTQCEEGLFCETVACGARFCVPRRGSDEHCTDSSECATGLCDPLTHACRPQCNSLQRAGCPNGLRELSAYLFFAAALGLSRRGRHW